MNFTRVEKDILHKSNTQTGAKPKRLAACRCARPRGQTEADTPHLYRTAKTEDSLGNRQAHSGRGWCLASSQGALLVPFGQVEKTPRRRATALFGAQEARYISSHPGRQAGLGTGARECAFAREARPGREDYRCPKKLCELFGVAPAKQNEPR